MNNKSGSTVLTFLLGAAAGAIAGILYAPDKGSNTRDKLTYRLDKYKLMLEDLLNDLVKHKEGVLSQAKHHGEQVVNEAKEKAERLLEDVDELINHIKNGDVSES